MRFKRYLYLLTAALLVAGCQTASESEAAEPETDSAETAALSDEQKTLYALGQVVAQQIGIFDLSEGDLQIVVDGLSDGILGRDSQVDLQAYGPRINQLAQERTARRAAAEKTAADEFLQQQAAADGAQTTDSGLIYTEIVAGSGASPAPTDRVRVHYHGTLRDGTVFDSSVDRGTPAEFALNQVVKCWQEGVQMMSVGGKSRLVCPASLAYGDTPQGRIPPGAALAFEVELLEILAPAGG